MGYLMSDNYKHFPDAYGRLVQVLHRNPTEMFALIVANPDIQPYQVHNVTAKTQHGWLIEHPTHHIFMWPTKQIRELFAPQTNIQFPKEPPNG